MHKPKMIEKEKDFYCSKGHNLPAIIISLDPKLSMDQRLFCRECLNNTVINSKVVSLQKINSLIEENQIKKMEIVKNQIDLFESLPSIADRMRTIVIQKLDLLKNLTMEWLQNLQCQQSKYSQYSFFEEFEIMFFQSNNTKFNSFVDEMQKMNLCWTTKLNPKLEQFNQFTEYKQYKELLSSLEVFFQKLTQSDQLYQKNLQQKIQEILLLNTKMNIPQSQTIQLSQQSINKPFTYQVIQEYSMSQNNWCSALAINKDCSTLLAGSNSQIQVFEFNKGMLKLIQSLNEHKGYVNTLNFMKSSNQFISGSHDQFIIIWEKQQQNQWISKQKLNGHRGYIFCLVLNNNENLIISGSTDKCIKFWIKKNEWTCQQTIKDHTSEVYQLSLNQQQNRLVSCGYDGLIIIIEQSEQNQEWIVKQKIEVEQFGYRVCFIDNNMFTFSPNNTEQISVYKLNNQFIKTYDIPVKCGSVDCCLFPQQYINSKCMLVSKNGEYVNFIKKKENGDLLTEQSIHFGTYFIYGAISDDGQYFITWDSQSNQIKIREFQEQ
ncbi:unnamed protein product [Paramecium pentaurelia]|uniref:WD domain, G-beta repeat protein n=1 Tax=Paramecium pentaurelia TaxID=43138 RepID=A0A8S1TUP3_9CILI|nr:unnamed protein product [Paramecium pentaurelia]